MLGGADVVMVGVALTVTFMVAVGLVQNAPEDAVTVYTPAAAVVALTIVGVAEEEVKLLGPTQL